MFSAMLRTCVLISLPCIAICILKCKQCEGPANRCVDSNSLTLDVPCGGSCVKKEFKRSKTDIKTYRYCNKDKEVERCTTSFLNGGVRSAVRKIST